jgi:CDP-glycerol glycerophosphotransferase (TagB/SpsB family)
MDIIDSAVQNGYQLCADKRLVSQTWEAFGKAIIGKKVFLYGMGNGGIYYIKKYPNRFKLDGIIDNDENKCGYYCAGDIYWQAFHTYCDKILISDIKMLLKYNSEDVVVLITSTKYYNEIISQLESIGIYQNYVMLMMEINQRKTHPLLSLVEEKPDYNEYVKSVISTYEIKPNKIVFKAFGTYSDHAKYITEQLVKNYRDLDIVWVVSKLDVSVPNGVRLAWLNNWKKYIYEMETAHIWIINTEIPEYIIKRQGQIYIHTKHWASVTLKKFYLDSSTITDDPQDVKLWRYNSQCMDYIITGSDFDTESCRRGFDFHKDVIQIGSPRSDAMFEKERYKEKICGYYHLPIECNILLYAPTYRYKATEQRKHTAVVKSIEIDYISVKNGLESRFGGSWYIILRLHPAVANESKNIEKPEFIIDASNYEDGEELASACDIMISDYSSIMFEPAFVKKPVFLFATDRKDYIDKEYDLLIDYDTLPFPIAETNEELIHNIKNFDQATYEKKVDTFMDKYGVHEDGHASERAAQIISNMIENGE